MSKTRVDEDGVTMEWDEEKRGWFPKLDDEFIYRYNLNYGFTDAAEETKPEESTTDKDKLDELYKKFSEKCQSDNIDMQNISKEEYDKLWYNFYQNYYLESQKETEEINDDDNETDKSKKVKRKATANKPAWFNVDESQNRHIYVENLPLNITLDEFVEFVSKVGMIMKDPITNELKVKLYKDKEGNLKGDGLACYIKVESIDLALQILDGYNLRGCIIKVSRAQFELKGNFDPKRRRRLTNKEKKRLKKKEEQLFKWGLDTKGTRPIWHNTVIIKNAFDPEEMKVKPELSFQIREIYDKALRLIGQYKKITVHELNPEAVVQIVFPDANISDIAVEYFNNKIWNGRHLTAELWDGTTKYKVKETEEQARIRQLNWDKSLGVVVSTTTKDSKTKGSDSSSDVEIKSDTKKCKEDNNQTKETSKPEDDENLEEAEEEDSGEETPDDDEVLNADSD